jgi:5'-nucleotidase
MRLQLLSLALAALLAGCATPPAEQQPPLQLRLLAINDFHGNLQGAPGGLRIDDPAKPGQKMTVRTGGAAQMATLLNEERRGAPHSLFVAAGDLVGATPLLSSIFRDEPTIEAMNLMGLDLSALGNHELDRGSAEALRRQAGGCHPVDGCTAGKAYTGAKFQYLAANTVVTASGKTLFPAYAVKQVDGVPVGFIGVILRDTPSVASGSAVAGLRFGDEADAVNAAVVELKKQGVEAIVVLMHEGGLPTGDYDACPGIDGAVVGLVKRFDKAVDVVVSGHTHRAYNCRIDGRVVTSAASYSMLLTRIDLQIDRRTRDVTRAEAHNLIVRAEIPPEPAVAALIADYQQRSGAIAGRAVTRLAAPFSATVGNLGTSELGQLVADAQLEATRELGAQMALMNSGGVRAPLGGRDKLDITYADVFSVQPFSNQLITMTITGEQLRRALEAGGPDGRRRLMVSRGFSYTWDAARPEGQRVLPESLLLGGKPIAPGDKVRVTVNSFMADGGDGLGPLRQGTERRAGPIDVDAFEAYLKARPGLAPDPVPRVTRLN